MYIIITLKYEKVLTIFLSHIFLNQFEIRMQLTFMLLYIPKIVTTILTSCGAREESLDVI